MIVVSLSASASVGFTISALIVRSTSVRVETPALSIASTWKVITESLSTVPLKSY